MSTKTSQSEKQKVPKLRFAGFDGGWEEKKLENILEFKNGINASKEQYGHGVKFINVLDIIENDYLTYDRIRGYVNIKEEEFSKNIVSYGDILFQRSSETREEVGQANVYLDKDREVTFGGFVIRGKKTGNYVPTFLNYLLQTKEARKDITSRSGGSTRYNIGQESLEKVKIVLPSELEQQKIAEFLGEMDELIKNLKEQKESFELYKKGMMQKIFSQEIRFKDENGKEFPEWEEKRLEEVGKIITGTTPSTLNKKYYSGHFPWVTPTDINGDKNIYTSTRLLTQEGIDKGRFVSKNSLLVTCIASIGKNAILRVDGSCNQQINAISPTIKNNVDFLYYILEKSKNTLLRFAGAGSMQMLNKKDFSDLKFKVPVLPEQQKIADFLTSIDKVIESKQQQISQAEQWKKGLMQGLFV